MNKRNIIIVIAFIIIIGLIAFAIWFFNAPKGGIIDDPVSYYKYDEATQTCIQYYGKYNYILKDEEYESKAECNVINIKPQPL